jgi:long-chain acyl-CoA synthetase
MLFMTKKFLKPSITRRQRSMPGAGIEVEGIAETMDYSRLDDKRGETVKVYVVVKSGESLAGEELIGYCRQRLAPYKLPKIVEFIDQLPKTPVGKIDRKALRAFDVAKRNQP